MFQTNVEVLLGLLEETPLDLLEGVIATHLFNEELFLPSEIDAVITTIASEFNVTLGVDKVAQTVKINLSNLVQETDMTNSNNVETNNTHNISFDKESYIETLKESYTTERLTSVLEAWLKDNPTYTPVAVDCIFTAAAEILVKLEADDAEKAEAFNDYLAEAVAETNVEAATPSSFSGKAVSNLKWVAAGAAVLGAGLETYANGEVTIGSGIGAAAGVGAAYFLTEKAVAMAKSENDYINLTLGGVMGLGLGAAGSALGRMGGEYVSPSNDQDEVFDQPGETYTSPLPVTPTNVTTEVVGL